MGMPVGGPMGGLAGLPGAGLAGIPVAGLAGMPVAMTIMMRPGMAVLPGPMGAAMAAGIPGVHPGMAGLAGLPGVGMPGLRPGVAMAMPGGWRVPPAMMKKPEPKEEDTIDPNNDVSCWSEHISEVDQRKYWYNKTTKTSTYDKPMCLKSPEERSIPPCKWNAFTTGGFKQWL